MRGAGNEFDPARGAAGIYIHRGPSESAAQRQEKEWLLQNGGFCVSCGCFFSSISACKFLAYRVCVRFAVHVRGR